MDDPASVASPLEVMPTGLPRRRRRFALSLRALMLLVLIFGGLLGWKARRVSIQRRSVATIRSAGGMVYYDHQTRQDGTRKSPSAPPAPEWLRRLVGDEPFQEVTSVMLNHQWDPVDDAVIDAFLALDRAATLRLGAVWVTDTQAARIAAAPHLKSLNCADAVIGHGGFERICRRADLESLTFGLQAPRVSHSYSYSSPTGQQLQRTFQGNDLITAGDVAPIRSLAHLKRLQIRDPSWTGFASSDSENYLPHLAALPQLESLEVWSRGFADADLRLLAPLERLETLGINGSIVTDDGLAVAARLPRLKSLSFWSQNFDRHRNAYNKFGTSARLTDAGLAHLTGCRRLEQLALVGDRFTDAGMDALAALPALRVLKLDGFDATPAGLGRLLATHQFEKLMLMGPAVGDWVAPLLAGQKALKELALIGPGLTDASAPGIARLPALESLKLHGTKLTDAGLAVLATSTVPIRNLSLLGTAVTTAGARSYRTVHPQAGVDCGPENESW